MDKNRSTTSGIHSISSISRIPRIRRKLHTLPSYRIREQSLGPKKTIQKKVLPNGTKDRAEQPIPQERKIPKQVGTRVATIQRVEKAKQNKSIRRTEIPKVEKFLDTSKTEKGFLHEENTSQTTRADIASEILAFEHFCEQRCTDEEDDTPEESEGELSDQDMIEQEDIMDEISDAWEEEEEY